MYRAHHHNAQGPRGQPPHTSHRPRSSVGSQVRESLPAVIIGLVLILLGGALLFWNEGKAVQTALSLDEGYNSVRKVQNSGAVFEENNYKLVHVWGTLACSPPMVDEVYGVQINAVKLKRRVQMHQWVEEERTVQDDVGPENFGDSASYSYSTSWKDKVVDSSSFNIPWGHENPTSMPINKVVQTAEIVKVGSYHLSPAFKELFVDFIPFSGDEQPEGDMRLHAGMYYHSRDIYNPEVGDVRVQFYYAGQAGDMVSVIGQQVEDTLHPYVTTLGRQLMLVQKGKRSVEEMFATEHAHNRLLTWARRIGGWFLMFIGLTCVTHIVQSLVEATALLQDVVALGLGSANLTLSMSSSLVIVGGAWCIYRPGLALLILAVATLPFIRAAAKHSGRPHQSTRPRTSQHGRV